MNSLLGFCTTLYAHHPTAHSFYSSHAETGELSSPLEGCSIITQSFSELEHQIVQFYMLVESRTLFR
jgi:hypothetical protein